MSPMCARRIAVVTESQRREREASPWTVLPRIGDTPRARPKAARCPLHALLPPWHEACALGRGEDLRRVAMMDMAN